MDQHARPAITFPDIEQAAMRLSGHAVLTPVLESHALNEVCGGRVLLKPETLQRTGSFKFRGAINALAALDERQRRAGVVTFSSGNHAQAVALAGRLLGVSVTVFMPEDAPATKIEGTRNYGADLVLYDRFKGDRIALASNFVSRTGATFVSPFDDPFVMAGQGTLGLELAQHAQQSGASIDLALVPCGGGGLCSGVATALKAFFPAVEVHAVEPEAFDDTRRSFLTGERQTNDPASRSICDALLSPTPGNLTFPILQESLAGVQVVSDAEVRAAMVFAFRSLKLVVEPGGCVALAALLSGRVTLNNRTAAVVLSGGNVDADFFAETLREAR